MLLAFYEILKQKANKRNDPCILVEFSSKASSSALNALFTSKRIFGMRQKLKTSRLRFSVYRHFYQSRMW